MKKALITGITGQDGSYLAEFLLEKGYEVHGITRRASISNTARIDHLMGKIKLHDGDLTDSSSLIRIIGQVKPDEIYNLAAQSHVQVSFDVPEYSGDVDALGVLRILEAVRICGLAGTCRIYQASTSELFGKVEEVPQRETTPFHPYSPYAVAKQYGFWMVKEYREAYGMFAVNGILFNHESERRGENFVTRKITLAAGRIAEGLQDHLEHRGDAQLRQLLVWIFREKLGGRPGSRYIIYGLLTRLLHSLGTTPEYLSHFYVEEEKGEAKILRMLNRYLENHFWQVEPESMERELHYSCNYLNKLVRKSTGLSFTEYCISRRLDYAAWLLINSEVSIGEIIDKCGYQNKTYFYRVFRNRFGQSPREYRKEHTSKA